METSQGAAARVAARTYVLLGVAGTTYALRVRFGFERVARDLRTRLLVVDVAGRTIGLLADEAREFVPIPDSSIHPPSDAIVGLSGNYLDGVATLGERIVLILNLRLVLEAVPIVEAS